MILVVHAQPGLDAEMVEIEPSQAEILRLLRTMDVLMVRLPGGALEKFTLYIDQHWHKRGMPVSRTLAFSQPGPAGPVMGMFHLGGPLLIAGGHPSTTELPESLSLQDAQHMCKLLKS